VSDALAAHSERQYDYVRDQFLSTRNAESWNPVMNWLWGGMQYQLEHHLFPTMPKYRYGALTYRIKQFAKDNGIEYKVDGMWGILVRNLRTMRKYALEAEHEEKAAKKLK
jgi:fatty acid desaturase